MSEKSKKKKTSLEQLEEITEQFIISTNNAKMQTFHKLNFHKLDKPSENEIHFTFNKDGQLYTIDKDGKVLDKKPFEL